MTENDTPSELTGEDDASPAIHAEVRRLALETLVDAAESSRFIDEVLPPRMEVAGERNRPLLHELTYGVLRHLGTLDALLDHHLRLPVRRQRPMVGWALRLAAYQIVYLTRVPAHAAVFQTLEALKKLGSEGRKAVGFTNAVLHKLCADVLRKDEAPLEDDDDPTVLPIRQGHCMFRRPVLPLVRLDLAGHLALKHSHPKWLVRRLLERFGEQETRALCAVNNEIPPVTARITSLSPARDELLAVLEAEGFEVAAGELEGSLRLERGDLHSSRARRDGWIQIQDETAASIGDVLKPPAGARVLDLCAAPGSKAVQLLERVREGGHLVALDASEARLELVRENLARVSPAFTLGVSPEDPSELDLGEQFSHILVDAPCSNTGVLARRPEARWRIRSSDFEELAALQSSLLEAAYRHLKAGGRLLYATCSIEPEENEEVVARFCEEHPDLTELETRYFLPHRSAGDGGFFSLLLRSR